MDLDQKDMDQVPWEAESSDTVDTVNPVSSMNDSSQESSSRASSREKAAWYIGVSGTVGGIAIFALGRGCGGGAILKTPYCHTSFSV